MCGAGTHTLRVVEKLELDATPLVMGDAGGAATAYCRLVSHGEHLCIVYAIRVQGGSRWHGVLTIAMSDWCCANGEGWCWRSCEVLLQGVIW